VFRTSASAVDIALTNSLKSVRSDAKWKPWASIRLSILGEPVCTPTIKPAARVRLTIEWFDLKNLPEKKEVAHHGWAIYTIEETGKDF
jgi:hypothetical protein